MRQITLCGNCGSRKIDCTDNGWWCDECNRIVKERIEFVESPLERTKRMVYATGNKWAIENFNATH